VRTSTEHVARLIGTEGMIEIEAPFWKATTAHLKLGKDRETKVCQHWANGYEYQAQEVARCVAAGLTESPAMTHAESLGIMQALDAARRELGVRYPFE
jgi:predicted dehydrogenase